jgi:spermidine synthase
MTGFAAVLACFVLSGFAALLFQTVWTRTFSFVFGTSELAVATVLAAYMGGLAAGSAVAARFAGRVRRPVWVYGALELAIALSALAVPVALRGATALHALWLGAQPDPPDAGGPATALFYLACAFPILLVPTGLMGATLPMLTRYVVRSEREIGHRVGLLYAANTAGAVAGTLVAAFVLLPSLGLRATAWVGAGIGGLVFLLASAVALASRGEQVPPAPEAAPGAPPSRSAGPPRDAAGRLILPAIALSGAVSFTYEVLWTRLLGHVLGGSVFAFATMLASFLVGIAVGSAIAARLASDRARAARGFGMAQLATAILSALVFAALDRVPDLARALGAGVRGSLGANALLAALALLPSALAIGATFPFAVRLLARDERDAAPATARVYAWNTVGAIAGAIGAGYLWIPAAGFAGTLTAAVGVNALLAAGTALVMRPRDGRLVAAAALVCASLALVPPATPWRILRSSPFELAPAPGEVTYFRVGRAATVLLLDHAGQWRLRTNGLPEAAMQRRGAHPGGDATGHWLGALPALLRPELRSLLVVGLGGGLAVEAVPRSVERIDVIELEPEVVEANRTIGAGRRRDPLADPRVRVVENDARGALALTTRRWDAVVSQPSHPWTAGASHLYTREFFQAVREHLEPGGVFVQWIGLAFVDEELVATLVATLASVFPELALFRPAPGGLLFAASEAPIDPLATAGPAIAKDPERFGELGILGPEDVLAAWVADSAGARRLAERGVVSTDDTNVLATASPRVFGRALADGSADAWLEPAEPLDDELQRIDVVRLADRLLATGGGARALRLAERAPDAQRGALARALAMARRGRRPEALAAVEAVLAADPSSADAQLLGVRLRGPAAARDVAQDELVDPAAAVAAAWSGDGEANARELDARLARVGPADLGYAEAARLRAGWRIASGDPDRCREAVAILDSLLARQVTAGDLAARARAAAQAGDRAAAVATLAELMPGLRSAGSPAALRDVRTTLDGLARAGEPTPEEIALREALRALSGS